MKLLLDANLSWRLAPLLAEHYGECIHINRTEIPAPATDTEIWNHAAQNGCIIITQDADFLNYLETKGWPPKVVLLRTGNMTRNEAAEILLRAKPLVETLEKSDTGLLEIV